MTRKRNEEEKTTNMEILEADTIKRTKMEEKVKKGVPQIVKKLSRNKTVANTGVND